MLRGSPLDLNAVSDATVLALVSVLGGGEVVVAPDQVCLFRPAVPVSTSASPLPADPVQLNPGPAMIVRERPPPESTGFDPVKIVPPPGRNSREEGAGGSTGAVVTGLGIRRLASRPVRGIDRPAERPGAVRRHHANRRVVHGDGVGARSRTVVAVLHDHGVGGAVRSNHSTVVTIRGPCCGLQDAFVVVGGGIACGVTDEARSWAR